MPRRLTVLTLCDTQWKNTEFLDCLLVLITSLYIRTITYIHRLLSVAVSRYVGVLWTPALLFWTRSKCPGQETGVIITVAPAFNVHMKTIISYLPGHVRNSITFLLQLDNTRTWRLLPLSYLCTPPCSATKWPRCRTWATISPRCQEVAPQIFVGCWCPIGLLTSWPGAGTLHSTLLNFFFFLRDTWW